MTPLAAARLYLDRWDVADCIRAAGHDDEAIEDLAKAVARAASSRFSPNVEFKTSRGKVKFTVPAEATFTVLELVRAVIEEHLHASGAVGPEQLALFS